MNASVDSIGRADHDRIRKFLSDAPVLMATAMTLEVAFDPIADLAVLTVGGRGLGSVVEASAWYAEVGADLADTTAAGLADDRDHSP